MGTNFPRNLQPDILLRPQRYLADHIIGPGLVGAIWTIGDMLSFASKA